MVEPGDRTGYVYNKVLIDSDRVITSSFPAISIRLTGEQQELLRNVVAYLGEITTFVDTYHTDYYIVPDSTDWETIQAIVADLEEKIMGSGNVPLDFNERWKEGIGLDTASVGANVLESGTVPAGYVYTLQGISGNNADNTSTIRFRVKSSPVTVTLAEFVSVPANLVATKTLAGIVLEEGDRVQTVFYGCVAGDDLSTEMWGIKTLLP